MWHFYLRRLHSLTGVVPVGIFLIQHMYANALALWGPETYDSHVHLLLDQPLLIVLEVAFVFAPLAFHAILGVYFMMDSRWNPHRYAYARNWLYTMQRITAWITLVYVIVHVAQTRFSFSADQKWEMYNSMQALFEANPVWLPIFYAIGVVAASFHLCNGLWAFCIVWGITVSRKSQQVVWLLCMGLFVLLSLAGVLSLLPLTGATAPFFE
jgi:succinate dehydrogenase / fumarate reductase, cytochrome b subunit